MVDKLGKKVFVPEKIGAASSLKQTSLNQTSHNHTSQKETSSTAAPMDTPVTPGPEGRNRTEKARKTLERLCREVSFRPTPELSVEDRAGRTAALRTQAISDPRPQHRNVFAAIDLGSSSAKMLILQRVGESWKTVVDVKIGCALGKGVPVGGELPEANQQRAVDALQQFVQEAARAGVAVADIPMITTSVVRMAPNGDAFVARVAAEVGLRPRILTGPQEADVGYRGALGPLLGRPGRYATLDLGGGSFQLAVGTEAGKEDGKSTEVGSNLILDTLINPRANPDGSFDGEAVFFVVDAELKQRAPMPLPPDVLDGRTLVATGGISKFLRAHFGKDMLRRDDIDRMRRDVAKLPHNDRIAFVREGKSAEQMKALGIETDEGALDYGKKLPASASLLLHILDGIQVAAVRVSETDARHALIHDALDPRSP